MAAVFRQQHAPGAVFWQQEITDTVASTMNGAITVGTKTASSISFSYISASDNVGVTGYEVSSNGGSTWLDNGLALLYTYLGLTELTSYDLRVRAYDAAGNRATPLAATSSTYRAGGTGQTIRDTTGAVGVSPAGILWNDVVLPGDAASWFSFRITVPPANPGALTISPNGTFTWSGGADTFTYMLEVNGVDIGTALVSLAASTATVAASGEANVARTATGAVDATVLPLAAVTVAVAGTASVARTGIGAVSVTVVPIPGTETAEAAGLANVIRTAIAAVNATVIEQDSILIDLTGLSSVVRLAIGAATLSIAPPSGEFLESSAPAVEMDLTVEQGTDYAQSFRRQDSLGEIVNLTGYTARMQVRRSVSEPTFLLELTTENGGLVIDGLAGQITIVIRDDQTTGASWRRGRFDIELISPAGRVSRFLFGRLELLREVTRVGD